MNAAAPKGMPLRRVTVSILKNTKLARHAQQGSPEAVALISVIIMLRV